VIQSFTAMNEVVREMGRQRIVVAAAHDEEVLRAIDEAACRGIAQPVLIGRQDRILQIARQNKIETGTWQFIDEPDDAEACRQAVRIIRQGEAEAIMKGLVSTALLLKAILNKETGIRDRALLSHIGLFFVRKIQRFVIVTDAAMSIAPDLATKKQQIENAVEVMQLLGVDRPYVACVCALEQINEAMPATVDAAELVRMNRQGEIAGCLVGGPFALDNALFVEAARRKGISDPVAGDPHILLMPNIESGNVLYKALSFLCDSPGAGLVVGARAPVILTSRSDDHGTKLNSIILALYLAALKKGVSC
jgi:phosphate butyryltransferase